MGSPPRSRTLSLRDSRSQLSLLTMRSLPSPATALLVVVNDARWMGAHRVRPSTRVFSISSEGSNTAGRLV